MKCNTSEFVVRYYLPGDEYAINDMFNEVFNQNRDLSHWYWKYRDNPYGAHFISLATDDNGTIAAHYGGYPLRLYNYISGSNPPEITTFHLCDKMTRKQFRSAGFGASSLLARTFMHFKETFARDIPFGYGFGTHHSLRFGLMFLNYAEIENIAYRRVNPQQLYVKKTGRLRELIADIKVNEVNEIDDSWTDFFYSAAPYYGCLIKRDAAYLKWRYLKRPDRKYLIISVRNRARLVGWTVFFREANKVVWGDAMFMQKDSDCLNSIFSYIQRHPILEGADFIECWFPNRPHWWDVRLQEIGFRAETEPNDLRLTGPIFNDQKAPEILKNNFYYTIGDSDLF